MLRMNKSAEENEVLGIRRLLMTQCNELNQWISISGIVATTTILENDYKENESVDEEASSYQPSKKYRTDLVLNSVQKCQLSLRDKKHADTVALYAPYSIVASYSVGSLITISNCKLCLSQGKKKKMYLVLSTDKSRKSCIEVNELQHPMDNGDTAGSKFIYSRAADRLLHLSPSSSIYSLLLTASHNRCLWTVQGHVTFLKKIFVSLRCSVCCRMAHSRNNQIQFTCPQRCFGCTVVPLWETSLAFDDGTAEADVRLEGKAALYVLRAVGDTQGLGLKYVQEKVDKLVQRKGKFMYDSITAKYERDTEEYADEVPFGSDLDSSDEISKLLDNYLINCSYLRNYELVCTVDHSSPNSAASVAKSSSSSSVTKKIHLQDVNTDYPHRIQFSAVATNTSSKLALSGHAVRELRGESLRLQAWDLLTTLEDDHK